MLKTNLPKKYFCYIINLTMQSSFCSLFLYNNKKLGLNLKWVNKGYLAFI